MRLYQPAVALLFFGMSPLFAPAYAQAQSTASVLDQRLATWLNANPVASYAPESDYGPFVYVDSSGKALGLSVDFLQLISQKTGLRLQAQTAAALSINLEKAKQKQVDILTSLRPTPERAEFLQFTAPYVSIPAALFLPSGKDSATNLASMHGLTVAVGKGYAVESFLRENFKEIKWVAVASDSEGLQQMAAGKVDGVVADIASVQFLSTQANASKVVQAAKVGFEYPLSFAFRKDKPELGEILQRGLQAISITERDQLLQKWMPQTSAASEQGKPSWLRFSAIALFVGAGLSLVLRSQRSSASGKS